MSNETFVSISKKVLSKEKRALTAKEIWNIAVEDDSIIGDYISEGRTPSRTIDARLADYISKGNKEITIVNQGDFINYTNRRFIMSVDFNSFNYSDFGDFIEISNIFKTYLILNKPNKKESTINTYSSDTKMLYNKSEELKYNFYKLLYDESEFNRVLGENGILLNYFKTNNRSNPKSDLSSYTTGFNYFKEFINEYYGYVIKPTTESELIESTYASTTKCNPLNQILYGPPGTGKTYNTINYAVAIIENKTIESIKIEAYEEVKQRFNNYQNQNLICFTTFHQSYSYEEFIEGIKPNLDTNEISYKLEDGIFKKFTTNSTDIKVYKLILSGTNDSENNEFKSYCFNNDVIGIGFNNDEDNRQVDYFINKLNIGDIIISQGTNNIIDAVGIINGPYYYSEEPIYDYHHFRQINWLITNIKLDSKNYYPNNLTRFTLNYLNDFNISKLIQDTDIKITTSNKVFIIDEINRGNISKVFGELITLVEETKRLGNEEALSLKLPYSKDNFGIPNNIYILGTMNTSDRSIALMDIALRRRFSFIEIAPEYHHLNTDVEGINLGKLLEAINYRITILLDKNHCIGHSYFMKITNLDELKEVFLNKIIPLLEEYFYEDYAKISQILNDNNMFIKDNLNTYPIPRFESYEDICKINLSSFDDIQSYIKIYEN